MPTSDPHGRRSRPRGCGDAAMRPACRDRERTLGRMGALLEAPENVRQDGRAPAFHDSALRLSRTWGSLWRTGGWPQKVATEKPRPQLPKQLHAPPPRGTAGRPFLTFKRGPGHVYSPTWPATGLPPRPRGHDLGVAARSQNLPRFRTGSGHPRRRGARRSGAQPGPPRWCPVGVVRQPGRFLGSEQTRKRVPSRQLTGLRPRDFCSSLSRPQGRC